MTARAKIDGRVVRFDSEGWTYEDTGRKVEDFSETGCLCQGCGRIYLLDVIVSDELWEIIKPAGKPRGAGMLCPNCIVARLERHLGFSVMRLVFR